MDVGQQCGNQSLLIGKISLSVFQNARLWQFYCKAPFFHLLINNNNPSYLVSKKVLFLAWHRCYKKCLSGSNILSIAPCQAKNKNRLHRFILENVDKELKISSFIFFDYIHVANLLHACIATRRNCTNLHVQMLYQLISYR